MRGVCGCCGDVMADDAAEVDDEEGELCSGIVAGMLIRRRQCKRGTGLYCMYG